MTRKPKLQFAEQIIVRVDQEIEDIVPVFWKEIHEDIEEIQAALKRSDYARIQALGHKVKGTAGGYGFETASDFGQHLELAAEQRDEAEIGRRLEEMLSYLSRVKVVFV